MPSVGIGGSVRCLLLLVIGASAIEVCVSAVTFMYSFSLLCIVMLSKIAFVASVWSGL